MTNLSFSVEPQLSLYPRSPICTAVSHRSSSTFIPNMSLPVHRWYRFSAGYSAEWVEAVISEIGKNGPTRVFDPFAGSGTTLLAAENMGIESLGIDPHPFVARIAKAKLEWRSDPDAYLKKISELTEKASKLSPNLETYPSLIRKCFDDNTLKQLDILRSAFHLIKDNSPASELVWLTLVGILRKVSHVGTAPWQYVLPNKRKRAPMNPGTAFEAQVKMFYEDMCIGQSMDGPHPRFIMSDARTCQDVPKGWANLVITSPPYPNNYDYADAVRLEMSFLGDVTGWGDLQEKVRQYLLRSCSQHVPESAIDLDQVLCATALDPIRSELKKVCAELATIRTMKGGKKTYHLMVACYFHDLALSWQALRRVCASPSNICFVIGDSAPYGVYVPVVSWLGELALAAGFKRFRFEKTRDRNVKWKNRKHRVPLLEGRLWVEG